MSRKSLPGSVSSLTEELINHRVSISARANEVYRYSVGGLEGKLFGGEVQQIAFVYGMSNEGRRDLIQTLV
jgi:hypothetical protein